jgi:aryl-alcohol dehydrogenase-like predicted oxidoreductase
MQYRRLGDAGVQLSEIGLGGWLTFGNAVEASAGRAVFDKAFDCGINFFDTANGYNRGKGEEAFGECLAGRRRESYVLATKVYFPMGDGPNEKGLSRKHIMEQCHASLKRLRTDHIDLYQCHRYDENVTVEEVVRAMDDLIRHGKVIYWGVSTWTAEQISECLRICGDRYYKPKGSQPRYNMIARDSEAIFPLCHKAGMGQVVYSPLAQGVLTGKYKPGQPVPADSRAADERQNQFLKKSLLSNEELLAKVQRLIPIADENHLSLSQLALAWNLRRPEVTSCIIGATKPAQIEQNVEASGVKLDEQTLRRIEDVLA